MGRLTALLRRYSALGCCFALAWLNLYVCREAFWLVSSGRMNSMQGVWIALAGKGNGRWLMPNWWPYWFGGMPMENTYAPAVPVSMSWIATVAGIPVSQAFHVVAAIAYALGPVALFTLLWRLTGRTAAAFAAAAAYSLYTPLTNRFYLMFVWDEVPHLLALALVCLAIAALHDRWNIAATLLIAAAFLTNAFALTASAVMLVAWTAATGDWRRALSTVLPAYLLVSPWVPPSLLETIRVNAAAMPERASPAGLAGSIALATAASLLARSRMDPGPRCLISAAVFFATVPWLRSLPQPDRYRLEAGLILVATAGLLMFGFWPRRLRAVPWLLAAVLLWPASQQLIAVRRFAKRELRHVPMEQSIEARVARWLEAHPDPGLVLAPGSIGQWLNVFSNVRQFGGGSYPTAINAPQQTVLIWAESIPADELTRWLQSYGVTRFVVPGPKSPEFWKPVRDPARFEGVYKLLWREDDTSIYEIPPGELAGTGINYHPGWRVTVSGVPHPYLRNDYGTITLVPPCDPPACKAEFHYNGGWEAILTRIASAAALMWLAVRAKKIC